MQLYQKRLARCCAPVCCQQYDYYVETTDVVNCGEMRPFWLSWDGGRVKVGHGSLLDRSTFMDWQAPEPRAVTYATFTTYYSSHGNWIVSLLRGAYSVRHHVRIV